jgi:hypothetical protein
MQLYMGAMGKCNNPALTSREQCVGTSRALHELATMPPMLDEPTAMASSAMASSAHALPSHLSAVDLSATKLSAAILSSGVGAALASNLTTALTTNLTAATSAATGAVTNAVTSGGAAASAAVTELAHRGVASARRVLKGSSELAAVWDGTGDVKWVTPRVGSFDDFPSAMLLLYVMSTGDEWEKWMYLMMDSTGPDTVGRAGHSSNRWSVGAASEGHAFDPLISKAPVRNDFEYSHSLLAIVWVFVGSLFAMNLFVGVIVDSFSRIKKETARAAPRHEHAPSARAAPSPSTRTVRERSGGR